MTAVEQALTAVVPLVVALLNLLVAGYALTAGLRAPEGRWAMVALSAGPGGVGVWALAWFVAAFDPAALAEARVVGWVGAVVAVLGLLGDALAGAGARWRWGVVGVTTAFAGAATAAVDATGLLEPGSLGGLFGRALALAGLGALAATRLRARPSSPRRARRTRWALAAPALGYAALAAVAYARGQVAVDVLLFVVLAVELLTWTEILEGRVRVEVLLPRAVAYAALAVVVAALAAWIYARLGYPLDPVTLAVTVAVALFASALFMGLSDPLTRRVERALFPEHARTQRALEASRGELSALRRRLERVERLAIAGELAASVAHEIKNPLAPIRGYAQMLEARVEGVAPEERALFAKGLRIIREEVDRIDARVAELLDLARVGGDAADLGQAFDVETVVRDAVAAAEAEPGATQVQLDLHPGLGRVQGDADAVRGALLNLLKNAAEAMAAGGGGRVEVRAWVQGAEVVLSILDEGPGLQGEDPERVFQTFYTTKAGGTGLGLAIARAALQAAGGDLVLRSRADRAGAEAQVRLTRVVTPEEVEA